MTQDLRRFITHDQRGKRFVLSTCDTLEDMQVSGEWIASTNPAEVLP